MTSRPVRGCGATTNFSDPFCVTAHPRRVTVFLRRAAVAPGPKSSRYERPRAVRRSRPDVTTVTVRCREPDGVYGVLVEPARPCEYIGWMAAADANDENLTDDDLQSEIELVGDLVVAASASDGPLSQDEVDRILGVSPRGVHPSKARPALEPES